MAISSTGGGEFPALAFTPLELAVQGFGQHEDEFREGEMDPLAYFAVTYIGRRGPVERRRPLFEHEWWSAESRMLTGGLRTNNAIESFRNAYACYIAQADRPNVARFPESAHTQRNMSCGAIAVFTHTPITDRELAEIEAGAHKPREKRQEGRNGRLATLEVRLGEGGGIRKYLRGVARNYMWRGEVKMSCSVFKVRWILKYSYAAFS